MSKAGGQATNGTPSSCSDASALFGAVATAYARHRLTYPARFFELLLHRLPADPLVWDCGCGSGQASLDLAERGARVIATDASAEQLAAARPHPRITYRQASADASGLATARVDGVVVAAAVHWFAGSAFNAEVQRVCRPGAVMAWIGYLPLHMPEPRLQAVMDGFHAGTLAPWWPAERRWVEQSYAGLAFPGEEWAFPQGLWIERRWSLTALLTHIGTWSAVQRCREAGGDPLPALAAALAPHWPAQGDEPLLVRWPFMGRWGAVQPAGSRSPQPAAAAPPPAPPRPTGHS
jgi:SAM-dependent methyltransferase